MHPEALWWFGGAMLGDFWFEIGGNGDESPVEGVYVSCDGM